MIRSFVSSTIVEVDSPFEKEFQPVTQLKIDGDLHMLDVVLKHDEILFGSTRYYTIDVYTILEVNKLFNEKPNKTDLDDYYSKNEIFTKDEVYIQTEAEQLLSDKADKTELIDSDSKNEADELLDEIVNEAVLDDYYSKTEIYAKIGKYNKLEIDSFLGEKVDIDTSYTKIEDDPLLLLQADKTDLIDSNTKSEDAALLLMKADKTDLIDSYTKSEDDAMLFF
ncbi:MAG: hypothetical protein EZS28_018582 [Streblomastix strix]|uniref:Uncharacterized protein n=1 Tax=Streblomastix strix TaxID=222440 RepID=A0A5J4VTE1_9EUKA|nr:MAG: hypothetical protein EZS28_018582 [Streblomastix strix]